MKKKVRKKFRAMVKMYTDGSMAIEPVEGTDWQTVNEQIKEDQEKRVPRAEAFLRELQLHDPSTPVPRNLLVLAAGQRVYRGPLRQAAINLSLLHVVQVLDE